MIEIPCMSLRTLDLGGYGLYSLYYGFKCRIYIINRRVWALSKDSGLDEFGVEGFRVWWCSDFGASGKAQHSPKALHGRVF